MTYRFSFSLVQSTVSELEEDGIIYTVLVKQQHGTPSGPQVNPISFRKHLPARCFPVYTDVFIPLFPEQSISLPAGQSRDRGETRPPSPSLLLYGRLLLHLYLPLHLSLLHLHQ